MQPFLCIYFYFLYLCVSKVFIISILVQFLQKKSLWKTSVRRFSREPIHFQKVTSPYSQKLATYVARRPPNAMKILLMERVFNPVFISKPMQLVYTQK